MYFKVITQNGDTKVMNLADTTKVGKTYKIVDTGEIIKVKNKVTFKYSMDDLNNLRVMLEGFEEGSYHDMFIRVMKAYNSGIPSIRFSSYEKELLQYLLEVETLSEFRKTLVKIIGGRNIG